MRAVVTLLCCLVVCHVTADQAINWSKVAKPAPTYKVDLDEPAIKRYLSIANII